jgi:hypothetical protein
MFGIILPGSKCREMRHKKYGSVARGDYAGGSVNRVAGCDAGDDYSHVTP